MTEESSLSSDFISKVDMAIEIVVDAKYNEPTLKNNIVDIVDVDYRLNKVLHGGEYIHLLPDMLRLNFDVSV